VSLGYGFDKETSLAKVRNMSRVTSKLQVTLPKAIADLHHIRPGTEIQFESAIDCIRIFVGQSRSALPLEEKLRLLREARARQQLRNMNFHRTAKSVRRGWKRDDLYQRGATH
jgi:bifunctional DNA-binding transcriptional regulator/antitoxin component of YhaV-PrlF toxin-antitoxin module